MLICNELSCIDQGTQLLIITNTMNITTAIQQFNFNIFLHRYFIQCIFPRSDFFSKLTFRKIDKNWSIMMYSFCIIKFLSPIIQKTKILKKLEMELGKILQNTTYTKKLTANFTHYSTFSAKKPNFLETHHKVVKMK